MSYPEEAWKRLGDLLTERRVQISPEYRNRLKFAAETGLNERLVSDLERGRRTSYRDTSLQAVEIAYQLQPGNITRALRGGGLEPSEPAVRVSPPTEAPEYRPAAVPDDRRVTVELPAGPDLSMDEAISTVEKASGPLTKEERILVNTLELMGYEPDVVAGMVILSRRAARNAGQDAGQNRKRA